MTAPSSMIAPTEPTILARPEHTISRDFIDPDVLRILYRLKNNDYEAYIVGGAIRGQVWADSCDSLASLQPAEGCEPDEDGFV